MDTEQKKIITATLGYVLVGLLSFISGMLVSALRLAGTYSNSSSESFLPAFTDVVIDKLLYNGGAILNLPFFLFLLFAYHFARQYSLERESNNYDNREKRSKVGNFLLIMLAIVLLGFFIYLIVRLLYGERDKIFIRDIVLLLSIFLPTFIWIYNTRNLMVDDNENVWSSAFRFPNRVYFPAIFCTMSAFLYGWSLPIFDEIWPSVYVFLTLMVIFVIYYYEMKRAMRAGCEIPLSTIRINTLIIIVLFLGAPFSSLLDDAYSSQIVQSLIFSFLFTFAIGVAEVAQRVYTYKEGNRYKVSGEGWEFYLSGANWGTLTLIPAVPMLAFVGNDIPAWFLAIYSFIHLIWWILARPESKKTSNMSIAFGFLMIGWVIAAVIVGSYFPDWRVLVSSESIGNGYSLVSAVVLFSATLLAYDTKSFGKLFEDSINFKNKRASLFLFIGIVVIFLIYTSSLASVASKFSNDSDLFRKKVWELQQIMVLLVLSSTLAFVIKNGWGGDSSNGDELQKNDLGHAKEVAGGKRLPKSRNTKFSWIKDARSVLSAFFALGRLLTSSIAGSSLGAILFINGVSSLESTVIASIVLTLITAFGFIVNDIFDLKKDTIGQRHDKPLVAGRVDLKMARALAVSTLLLACLIGFLVFHTRFMVAILALAVALTFYSAFSQRFPYFKGAYTALLCLSPLVLAEVLTYERFVPAAIYLFGFIFFVGREMFFDVIDIDADKSASLRTIPTLIGHRNSLILSWVLMCAAFFLVAISIDNPITITLSILALLALGVLWFISRKNMLLASNWTRLHLLLGVGIVCAAIS